MMRPVLAALIIAIVLGSVGTFLRLTANPPAIHHAAAPEAEGVFSIELLLTFDAGPDPFALTSDQPASVTIEHHGTLLWQVHDTVRRGDTIRVPDVTGITAGTNTFHVVAVPMETEDLIHAARVRVFRNDLVIGEAWVASDAGRPISDSVSVEVSETAVEVASTEGAA